MKLTNEQMLESLYILSRAEETGKLGFACARNRRKLTDEVKEYVEKRDEILAKYGDPTGENQFLISAENRDAFEKELGEYSGIECDVAVMTVDADTFCNGHFNSQEMFTLDWMVED